MRRTTAKDETEYEFPFTVLAEKHNAVIRTIREIPPWEWGGEFLELEPQVLRFLGTFAKRYPECAVAEIIKAIVHEHEQTRQMITETNGLVR